MKFNKKIFFIMTIFTLLLVGCDDKSNKNEPDEDKDKRLQTFYSGGIVFRKEIVVDTKTGVNYLIVRTDKGVSITVMYDEDGKILTNNKKIKNKKEIKNGSNRIKKKTYNYKYFSIIRNSFSVF